MGEYSVIICDEEYEYDETDDAICFDNDEEIDVGEYDDS